MNATEWDEMRQNDPRSVEELVQSALTEADEEKAWFAVNVLHFRSTLEVLDAAMRLTVSSVARERQLGADILGQFRSFEKSPDRCFEQTVERLLSMIPGEDDPGVLNSIGVGLGHRGDPRCVEPLSQLSLHSHPDVRLGVVHGISRHSDPLSIQTMIRLTQDAVSEVRDWATFALGQYSQVDTPDVREALWQRTNDEDDMTRLEALSGLALRHDDRIIPLLIDELSQTEVYRVAIEAAGDHGSPLFLQYLLELQANCEWNAEFTKAIADSIAKCQAT